MGKTVKLSVEGKRLVGNWQLEMILIIMKKKALGLRFSFAGAIFNNIQTRLLVYTTDLR